MADNVAFTPGSGATGAADDIGGVFYPRVKIALGADGSASDAVSGTGTAGAGVIRTVTATDDPGVAALGTSGTSPPTFPGSATGVMGWLRYLASLASGYTVAVALTRTADTAVYAANDVVGASVGASAALQFANIGPNAGQVMITSAELRIDAAAVISGETSYRLYLYNVTPPSALVDNAAWDLPSGDRASFLGYIDLGTPVDLGSTLYIRSESINAHFALSNTDLFGYLVTAGGHTPTSARVYTVTLHAVAL